MVTHQLQVERRTGKVRRPEIDVLPLCHATNLSEEYNNVNKDIRRLKVWSTSSSCYELRTVTDRRAEWQQHYRRFTIASLAVNTAYQLKLRACAMAIMLITKSMTNCFRNQHGHSTCQLRVEQFASILLQAGDSESTRAMIVWSVNLRAAVYDTIRDAILTCARKPT